MTADEKDLLLAYLADAGEIDPEGDVEAQFQDWYQVRQGVVSGETHYKAILEAARVRKRNFDRGYRLTGAALLTDRQVSATTILPEAATVKATPRGWPRAQSNAGAVHWRIS